MTEIINAMKKGLIKCKANVQASPGLVIPLETIMTPLFNAINGSYGFNCIAVFETSIMVAVFTIYGSQIYARTYTLATATT